MIYCIVIRDSKDNQIKRVGNTTTDINYAHREANAYNASVQPSCPFWAEEVSNGSFRKTFEPFPEPVNMVEVHPIPSTEQYVEEDYIIQ